MASTTPEAIAQQKKIVHYTSLAAVFVCPILIALPPRKFDKYTVAALISTGLGANELTREYTGWSVSQRISYEVKRIANMEEAMPSTRAEEVRALLRAEKAAREANSARGMPASTTTSEEIRAMVEKERAEKKAKGEDTSVLDALIAKEPDAVKKSEWKRKRDEYERQSLEEGKSYADMIVEQIWDVWSWGTGKTAEDAVPATEQQAKVKEALKTGEIGKVVNVAEKAAGIGGDEKR